MNTALIIDNEMHDAEKLIREIKMMDKNMSIGGVLESVEQSMLWFEKNPSPDLIFMDVNLKDGNSFHLFNRHCIKCPVIFTVHYEERMIKAFHENQINYLLKPVNHNSFRGMVTKVRNNQLKINNCQLPQHSLLKSENAFLSRLVAKNGIDHIVLALKDIAYFKHQDNIVSLVTANNKKFISNKTLQTLSEELNPKIFYRITRQFIINGNYISSFRPIHNGCLRLLLKIPFNDEIIISKSSSAQFIHWIETCREL